MKIAPVAEVKVSEDSPVIVTKNGKPVAVLVGVSDEDEIERLVFACSKNICALLDAAEKRIQAGGGIEHDELWRQLEQG